MFTPSNCIINQVNGRAQNQITSPLPRLYHSHPQGASWIGGTFRLVASESEREKGSEEEREESEGERKKEKEGGREEGRESGGSLYCLCLL